MSLTRDKQMQMVRKWHTLIEAHTKVKTTDGYILRMFCMAFTKRRQDQVKNTCYAGSAQIRKIRKKMVEVMQKEASKSMLRDLVKKLIPEALGKEIEKVTRGTYPIQNCLIRKVKMVEVMQKEASKSMLLLASFCMTSTIFTLRMRQFWMGYVPRVTFSISLPSASGISFFTRSRSMLLLASFCMTSTIFLRILRICAEPA